MKETGDSRYFYLNELDKACFQHDMAYGNFKDLNRRTFADEILHDKTFNIAKDPRYDGYEKGLASVVYKFFDKEASGSCIKNDNISNKELLKELHKRKIFNKRKVRSPFIDNICRYVVISKFNKRLDFYCVIDIYSNYELAIPLKDKRELQLMPFRKF